MAFGKHVCRQEVFNVSNNKSNGFQRTCLHVSTEKIMKQVEIKNKEELDKNRFQVHFRKQSPGKVKRLSFCKRKSCSSVEVGTKLHRSSSDVGRPRDPGMANKENELSCSDDVRGIRCYDNHGLLVNSAEASKMAGASSKYSDFTELSKEHEAMSRILFGRDLRLKVALTLWRRNASELVSYLIRIQEEHITAGLHWIQSVVKKWWPDLSKSEKRLRDSCSDDRNIEMMRQRLKDLWKEGSRLCSVPGSIGELAKAIEAYLLQLP
uniref:Katanin p80 subunit B-like 1 n=1 Tax=Nothobranchius korthausae TaxID=1143690 RepID=A0A1A8HEN2_9TELE